MGDGDQSGVASSDNAHYDGPAAFAAGARVDDYEILDLIGSGGFGHVYSARHTLIGKRAALKVLHAEHAQKRRVLDRFVAEARAVNQIQDRGIVDIFGFGSLADGRQYLAMELLEGKTLDALVRTGRGPSYQQTITILKRVARALDAAHGAGIAHRDLKPDNIFVTTNEEGDLHPKLLDFGIAKLMREQDRRQTQTGQMLGTPLYMSPEQWRGRNVDHRTDIYALGVVAYELLTGAFPFNGQTRGDMMINVCTVPPTPAQDHVPELPLAVNEVLAAMLEKEPNDRPSSASGAIAALAEALQEVPDLATHYAPHVVIPPTVPASDAAADRPVQGDSGLVGLTEAPATDVSTGGHPRSDLGARASDATVADDVALHDTAAHEAVQRSRAKQRVARGAANTLVAATQATPPVLEAITPAPLSPGDTEIADASALIAGAQPVADPRPHANQLLKGTGEPVASNLIVPEAPTRGRGVLAAGAVAVLLLGGVAVVALVGADETGDTTPSPAAGVPSGGAVATAIVATASASAQSTAQPSMSPSAEPSVSASALASAAPAFPKPVKVAPRPAPRPAPARPAVRPAARPTPAPPPPPPAPPAQPPPVPTGVRLPVDAR